MILGLLAFGFDTQTLRTYMPALRSGTMRSGDGARTPTGVCSNEISIGASGAHCSVADDLAAIDPISSGRMKCVLKAGATINFTITICEWPPATLLAGWIYLLPRTAPTAPSSLLRPVRNRSVPVLLPITANRTWSQTRLDAVGWIQGRGVMVPLLPASRTQLHSSKAVVLSATPLDLGTFRVKFEVHVGDFVSDSPKAWDGLSGCEATGHNNPYGRFHQCPSFQWQRSCKEIELQVDINRGSNIPSFNDGTGHSLRVIDDPAFLQHQLRLPLCRPVRLHDAVNAEGHFVTDPARNPQVGRWVSVKEPLAQPSVLITLLWPKPGSQVHRMFAGALKETGDLNSHLAWVPYTCRLIFLDTNAIRKCLGKHAVVYAGDSRVRTQFYNIAVLAEVADPFRKAFVRKAHDDVVIEAPLGAVEDSNTSNTSTIVYHYLGCKEDYNRARRYISYGATLRRVSRITTWWDREPRSSVALRYTNGYCQLAYGDASTLQETTQEQMTELFKRVLSSETATNVSLFIAPSESPWRFGASYSNYGRVLFANQLLLDAANEAAVAASHHI